MSVSHPMFPPTTGKPVRTGALTGLRLLLVVAVAALSLFAVPVDPRAEAAPGPWFAVVRDADIVLGDDWFPGAMITVTVDDPTNGVGVDHFFVATTDGAGWFYINVGSSVDIQPGFIVKSTDGSATKTHVVTGFTDSNISISAATDAVAGKASPGATVETWVHGDPTPATVTKVADSSGFWYANYSGIWDIVPGAGMGFRELDPDGDGTQIDAFAPLDIDGDGIVDAADNCPSIPNVTQYDGDGDGTGARCDDVDRVWGPNRYGTSAAVAEMAFETADTVFIALGTNFPDALVAAAAGGHRSGPVLLTETASLPPETIAELSRLSPSTAYLVGGTAVISPAVEQQVRTLVPTVTRLAGANRYETSAAVSSTIFPTANRVFVALGENFPDALVAAAAAGYTSAPVLLTPPDHVPQATLDELVRLTPTTIYVVGGTAAISEMVAQELAPYGTVVRLAGANRYETAAAVAEEVFVCEGRVFLASGANFPDALVAAAAGGHIGGPVLLVTHDTIPAATRGQLDRLNPQYIWLVGGTAVIGNSVFNALP